MSATVTYKGSTIGTASNSTLTLYTAGTWVEDDIEITDVTSGGGSTLGTKTITANGTYSASSDGYDGYSSVTVTVPSVAPTGTKQISITENGITTEDVTNYANAEITVNVSGGGSASIDSFVDGTVPTGATTLSTATSIIGYGLANRTSMTSLSAPYVTSIGAYALSGCTGLTSISFPSLTSFGGDYALTGCTGLTSVAFPSFTNQSRTRTFNNCSSLTVADFGNCTKISSQTFNGANALRTLVLRKADAICTLDAWNAITIGGIYNNPTASTIYVPSALISTYESASNWASAKTAGVTFAAIEGSAYA